jgi:capsular polysaccharide biosynthesis protein
LACEKSFAVSCGGLLNLIAMNNQEEISLRDIYLILKKNINMVLGTTFGVGLIVLLVALVLPSSFSSQVVLNLAVDNERSEFKAAPTALGLSQGFIQLVNNESLAQKLQESRLQDTHKAKFDDKKSLLTLIATGSTANQAFERAGRFEAVAVGYFQDQIAGVVRTNIGATLSQTKLDIATTRDNLKRLEQLLQTTQGMTSNSTNAAALESRGVNPQLARAENPALVNLTLQISQLKVTMAAQQARQVALETTLNDKNAFSALLGQGFQVQVLSKPTPAFEPEFPKPGLMTALGLVAGLLLGVIGVFVMEALRLPQDQMNLIQNDATQANNAANQRLPQANPGD